MSCPMRCTTRRSASVVRGSPGRAIAKNLKRRVWQADAELLNVRKSDVEALLGSRTPNWLCRALRWARRLARVPQPPQNGSQTETKGLEAMRQRSRRRRAPSSTRSTASRLPGPAQGGSRCRMRPSGPRFGQRSLAGSRVRKWTSSLRSVFGRQRDASTGLREPKRAHRTSRTLRPCTTKSSALKQRSAYSARRCKRGSMRSRPPPSASSSSGNKSRLRRTCSTKASNSSSGPSPKDRWSDRKRWLRTGEILSALCVSAR